MQTETFYIYLLRNPKNDEIFYVGCTSNPSRRLLFGHNIFKRKRPIVDPSLKEQYMIEHQIVPKMEILQTIEFSWTKDRGHWFTKKVLGVEQAWIYKLISEGHPLTNVIKRRPRGTVKTVEQ